MQGATALTPRPRRSCLDIATVSPKCRRAQFGALAPRSATLVDNVDMNIEEWWPKLRRESREYLIANNGDVVPAALVAEITRAGGDKDSDAWRAGDSGADGFYLTDEAIDWIDEVANGETPPPRRR